MKRVMTVDGNEACAYTAYMFTELSSIYPITPSSPMAEHIDEWSNQGRLNIFNDQVKVIEMQSEAGAAGLMHGSLQSGVLTTTFTASQGLLLMIPNMYKMAGEMLPGVIHVAARSLSTHSLSILGDHQDIYATRSTGFCMLSSSSVQDACHLGAIAHLSSIKASLPFLHFFDGFRTSHEINKINVLEMDDYKKLIDYKALEKFRNKALNPMNPKIIGTASNDDIYFQVTESRNKYYDAVPDIVNDYMKKINDLAGTNYKPFNYYGSDRASNIIVAMGSVCETIKETIDDLNDKGYNVGLVEVHLYRPFSSKYLLDVIPNTVKNIAVIDRTKEAGSIGEPLYLDVKSVIKDKGVYGGRYGLSSKNTTPKDIKAVYDMLINNPHHNFTIGITDDVTNLSLDVDDDYRINKSNECLIYGFGSDGSVSAAKSMIKIIGENSDNYVQGYFEYDSKKSGGVTKSHLRFSDSKIRSSYYVENPSVIVITKDTYLNDFDCYSNIKENGTILINTTKSDKELISTMDSNMLNIINERNITVYRINALEIARNVGLGNKISMAIEYALFKLMNILDEKVVLEKLKESIYHKFYKKGEEVVNANIKLLNQVDDYLKKVDINILGLVDNTTDQESSVIEQIMKRRGNSLKTSDVIDMADGSFEPGTSRLEKKDISDVVPSWIGENCINCNQCSMVCPHGVIRPFLLSKEEYDNAPLYVKEKARKPFGKGLEDYYYVMGISIKNCTGCGLCYKTCPGFRLQKALMMKDIIEQKNNHEQEIFDYLVQNTKEKHIDNVYTIKNSQFNKPRFAFSGACAGCGETPYLKLLTQLYGDHMIIANATGCSSIYGASIPSMPYTVPWASSLFEDNAEYAFGMLQADNLMKNRIKNIMINNMDNSNSELFKEYIDNINSYEVTKKVYDNLDYNTIPTELSKLKDYIIKRSIWCIGGDGWAYDIGFGGIDHVLSSNDNVNILVLDTEVYSNTGGQSSKSSHKGSIASFTSSGKKNHKKDLARIALNYPNCYVATVNMGYNMQGVIKALKEAEEHNGPSIIIAYSSCIAHGIVGGLSNSLEIQKLATTCGYFPTFRYVPESKKFTLDSTKVDFDKYEEFLNSQNRYRMLKNINPTMASSLLEGNKEDSKKRFDYYKKLDEESKKEI